MERNGLKFHRILINCPKNVILRVRFCIKLETKYEIFRRSPKDVFLNFDRVHQETCIRNSLTAQELLLVVGDFYFR